MEFKDSKKLDLIKVENVAAIDIDGVIADYPTHFIRFVNEKLSKNYLTMVKDLKTIFHDLSNEEVEKLKIEYRQSGVKRKIPITHGSLNFLRRLKEKDFSIILLTSRSFKEYVPRVYEDTLFWLKSNKLPFDFILWREEKRKEVLKNIHNLRFIVEDRLDNANKLCDEDYRVYVINKPYNQGETNGGVIRVNYFNEILRKEGLYG